jgi:hypothetical protein
VVGAPDYFATGGVSVYYGSATGPATTASWKVTSEQNNSHFGSFVGTAGDVNGDGDRLVYPTIDSLAEPPRLPGDPIT